MAPSATFLTLDQEGRATFPEEVRAALGVKTGDVILLEKTEKGTFELVPAELIPRDQLWFYDREVQTRVAEAEADFAAGRFVETRTPDDAQVFLDRLKTESAPLRS